MEYGVIAEKLGGATELLASKEGMIVMALGFLFVVAKRVSNEKAGPIVAKIQGLFDGLGSIFEKAGLLCKKIGEILSNIVKSDGFMGNP